MALYSIISSGAEAAAGNPLAVLGGANLLGSIFSANAAKSAANTQSQAASNAQQQLQQNFQNLSPNYSPYTSLGAQGAQTIQNAIPQLTAQSPQYQNFTAQDLNANLAPNYAFQLQQGQNATNLANNATGGLIGGNALKGLQDYTQNYASGAYQNALTNYMGQQNQGFNQNQTQQTNIFNRLSGIANIGQNAVTGLSNLATGNATSIAQLGVGAANAQAAGQVGAANAVSSGLQNTAQSNYLSTLLNPNTYAGANAGSSYNLNQPGGISQYFQTPGNA